jgi:hypothetical protein
VVRFAPRDRELKVSLPTIRRGRTKADWLVWKILDAQKRFGGSETMRQVELEGVGS